MSGSKSWHPDEKCDILGEHTEAKVPDRLRFIAQPNKSNLYIYICIYIYIYEYNIYIYIYVYVCM